MTANVSSATALQGAPRAIRRGLRSVRLHVRFLLALRLSAAGIAVVAAVAALAVLMLRLLDMWYPPLAPEVALGAVLILSCCVALIWPLPDRTIAASTDRRLGLRDRIGSAVQFVRGRSPSGMQQATILDAVHYLTAVRPGQAFPIGWPRGAKAAGVCLFALLLVQVLPIPALLLSAQEREEKAELREHAAQIEPLAKDLEQAALEADDEEAKEVARQLRKLVQQLQRGRLDKKKALLGMDELEKKLEKLEQRLERARPKTAGEAAEKLRQAAQKSVASKAMELARQARERGDERAAKQLEQMAKQARESRDASQLRDLARQLEDRAAELGASLGLPPETLSALSEFLGGGDLELSESAMEKLAALSDSLSQGSLTAADLEALALELEELSELLEGTDLAELAELLAEASECLKAGDCKRAGSCLGKAVGLCKAKLAKLGLAGACRAGRLGLGRCYGRRFRWGGGGPMRQDHIPPNAPTTQLFAPRQSDNPGDLERVRAKISPGGPMITTTEKGAPVKITESRVPYYEVISDYSKTAEEALSKEEVPPAYRGTVRAYFDALQSGAKAAKE